MAKKRRTTFLKTQKERARLEKQAEKRARRQNRETDVPGDPSFAGPQPLTESLPEVVEPPV